jgi:hypothetical protein
MAIKTQDRLSGSGDEFFKASVRKVSGIDRKSLCRAQCLA